MKAGLAILLFLLTGFSAFSQKDYFIYLQTDNSQPFYLLMDGKTYSSSDHGYLILSGLQGQAYQFVIGFPRNVFPEQNFIVNVYNKDAGYQLKNFADKGWGLVNYQTSEATMNRNSERGNSMISGTKKTDNFSVLLSNVVNDTSILYESVTPQTAVAQTTVAAQQPAATQADTAHISKEQHAAPTVANSTSPAPGTETPILAPVAAVTAAAAASNNTTTDAGKHVADTAAKAAVVAAATTASKTDTLAAEKKVTSDSAVAKIPAKMDSAVAVVPAKPVVSNVKKISVSSSEIALEEVFIDSTSSGVDTIRIATLLTKETTVQAPAAGGGAVAAVAVTPAETPKADTMHKQEITDTTAATKPVVHHAQINNSDCRNTATDADIDKLRVKLLSLNDLDEKIATTKKLLKSKCFTVKQLKAISELFVEEESKYQLFETAYPFTLDTYNYPTLEDLLKSDYYRDRFKAMIKR
ncbi:DUF4476 domain-containing protein [Chitinophagaceae bacterium 26-R-25]|nr:DUF4476 domain-containing protein [Chitinophagaceae bacterium 26-R-25]